MKKTLKTISALAMTILFAAAVAFAQTDKSPNSSVEKIELNKLGESKDAAYDMKGGETRKFEIAVKEAGKLQIVFPIYAPMFKSAGEVIAADNVVGRDQPSNVSLQKSLEWKLKKGDQEVGSGTNVVKFGQLTGRIIPSTIQYDQVSLFQPGTYVLEIKCEPHFKICSDKAGLTLMNPAEQPLDPTNMGP